MNKVKNNNQDNNRSNFDDILNYLGNIGRYQWEIYILSILPVFIAGMLSTSFIFTTATPDYRSVIIQNKKKFFLINFFIVLIKLKMLGGYVRH